jgi:hypothetical protein
MRCFGVTVILLSSLQFSLAVICMVNTGLIIFTCREGYGQDGQEVAL